MLLGLESRGQTSAAKVRHLNLSLESHHDMLELPQFDQAFDYENNFYLSCSSDRIAKVIALNDAYRRVSRLPGVVVECGVFKGASLITLATLCKLFEGAASRPLFGFDVFGAFPETSFEPDKPVRQRFVDEAGDQGLTVEQLQEVLGRKHLSEGVELIRGDIVHTVPRFLQERPALRCALLNLDTDIYEPAKVILEHFWPRMVSGGVMLLDDYGVFPGETQAADEFFAEVGIPIQRFSYRTTPCFVVKP